MELHLGVTTGDSPQHPIHLHYIRITADVKAAKLSDRYYDRLLELLLSFLFFSWGVII
jgi:hypothetical protein